MAGAGAEHCVCVPPRQRRIKAAMTALNLKGLYHVLLIPSQVIPTCRPGPRYTMGDNLGRYLGKILKMSSPRQPGLQNGPLAKKSVHLLAIIIRGLDKPCRASPFVALAAVVLADRKNGKSHDADE